MPKLSTLAIVFAALLTFAGASNAADDQTAVADDKNATVVQDSVSQQGPHQDYQATEVKPVVGDIVTEYESYYTDTYYTDEACVSGRKARKLIGAKKMKINGVWRLINGRTAATISAGANDYAGCIVLPHSVKLPTTVTVRSGRMILKYK